MNKYYVRQNGFKDCGPSCLLSIMKYYGCEASHEEVSYILKTDQNGTNAYNIINGSRSFGFDGYGIHLSYDEIIENKISFPIICHVKKDNMFHFIVVYKVKKNKLYIMDPSSNKEIINSDEFKNIYLNTSIFVYPVKDVKCEVSKDSMLTYLFTLIRLERNSIIKLTIFSIVAVILGILLNYYFYIIVDYLLPHYNNYHLFVLSILFLIIVLIKSIINYIKGKVLINIIEKISINFNNLVLFKIFNLPYLFFKNKSSGEVISRINDLKEFKEVISQIIVNVLVDCILVSISVIVLLLINIKLFALYLFEMILYLIIVLIYRRIFRIKSENILVSEGKYNKSLNDNIYGYESNLNINLINESLKEIQIRNIDNTLKSSSYSKTLNSQMFLKELIVDSVYIISLLISAFFIHNNVITIGEVFLFNGVIYYFTEPLKNILDLDPNINHIKNIYNRINDLLIYKNKTEEDTLEEIKGDINIKNLSYSYDGLNYLFKANFNIKYGSRALIYGNSGIGKSTILKIMLKYLNDYKGDIYLNNINIKDINKNIIANSFTYVSQNSYIKNDTLKNNIIYYRNISNEEYEKVIHICNLDKLRNSSKLRDNFIIEDDGFNVSGGERQKIVLARSLLKHSNYILLDEALSEVGFNEEKQIIERLFETFKDKTIIYVSHKKEIIDLFKEKYEIRKEEK